MTNRIVTRDKVVGDKTYQIKKMDARTACWLFSSLSARTNSTMLAALGKCSQTEFEEIQNIALSHVVRLDEKDGNVFPMPIIGANGVWADKDLATDAKGVMDLTVDAILFNIEPFLEGNKSTDQR